MCGVVTTAPTGVLDDRIGLKVTHILYLREAIIEPKKPM
jgi:hypothetical protein